MKHEPNAMFTHVGARWPGVVIEVSYSQKRKDLRDLADDYILESNGGIGLVIGLDIEYRGSRKATVSTWRLKQTIDEQGEEQYRASPVIENQIFRDEDGKPNTALGSGLRIELKDFVWGDLSGEAQGFLEIDSATLCKMLEQAEEIYGMWKRQEGSGPPEIQASRKRRRERTPIEEPDSDDDEWGASARRVRQKTAESDSSYHDSSPPKKQRIAIAHTRTRSNPSLRSTTRAPLTMGQLA